MLAEDGYSGVEVRVTPMCIEIIIRATRAQNILARRAGGSESWLL
ncbi:40S ribosomal protein S3-1 [Zea mays]|uniref:40S ribosomal protein S3-1 n=1 Tax=Zea mays TaxID=4577 RepID=A0A1D6F166_MAIZE|nr:40S ribosomal protein S3-1 [Zea mays]